ncbi:hypothetical protein BGZ58_000026 [Dissophora ornata]|nr:hypothetical protein BGZ58_000026 [Dissophora ornata]
MEDISVFDIPLLNREVTQRLSKHDLKQCCLVSKQWYEWFIPVLWHSIELPHSVKAFEAVRRHRVHVRNILVIDLLDAVVSCDCWSFPALQSITFTSLDSRTSSHKMFRLDMKMLRLLETSPFLRSLNIKLSLNHVEVYNQLLHTLQSLQHLQKLKLTCDNYVNPVYYQQIIENCRHCESIGLTFGCYTKYIENKEQYALAKSGFEKMPDTRLRELFFEFHTSSQQTHILAPLLQCSPLLESLHLEDEYNRTSIKHLTETFQSLRTPRLKKLYLGHKYSIDCDIADLLRSIGSEDDKDDSDMERRGLETLEQWPFGFGKESALALTTYHARTLTTLEFLQSQVELQLFIGKLEDLEELEIEDYIDVLLLEDGYLDLLSNLKFLKEISIYYHDDSRMAGREAEWMVATWPKLARFSVVMQDLLRSGQQTLDAFEKAMLEKKPSIQFDKI